MILKKKGLVLFIIQILFSPIVFLYGLGVGFDRGAYAAYKKEGVFVSNAKISKVISKDVAWIKMTEIQGGYDVWKDVDSAAISITKNNKRLLLVIDNAKKTIIEKGDSASVIGQELFVDIDQLQGVDITVNE